MWQDNVDNWLEDNSVRGGISSEVGVTRMFNVVMLIGIHMVTFGITYVLWRIFRDKDEFYNQYVYSKKNKHQNICSEDSEKRINKILAEEQIELKHDEEVLFYVKDVSFSDNGLVFTNERLVYKLLKPKAVTGTSITGQVPLAAIGNKLALESSKLTNAHTIKVDNEEIGKLSIPRGDVVADFLVAIRKSIQNANA